MQRHHCVLLSLAWTAAAPLFASGTSAATRSAPADAYFGVLKMTPLEIRVKVDQLGRAYHARWSSDHDIIHEATFAESALRAWRNAYPRDPWLAPTAYHLEVLYAALQLPEGRKHAVAMARYVDQYWPTTPYGRTSRLRLSRGFPPIHAESPVHPTPNPYVRTAAPAAPSPRVTEAAASPSPVPSKTPI